MLHKKILNLILVAVFSFALTSCTGISKESAGLKAEEYLGKNVLKNGIKAKVAEVTEENGFYTVALQISKDDTAVDKVKVYVTKDGNTLSLGPVFDLNKSPEEYKKKSEESAASPKAQDLPKKDKPTIELFVMSGCPYGVQAEQAFSPVMKLLGDKVDFQPRFIVYSGYRGGGPNYCIDKASKYCSMHGAEEAREDVRQICIWKEQKAKWWAYIDKFNEKCSIDAKTPACSKEVAKEVGVDYAKVEACLKNSAEKLLEEETKISKAKKADGSPTIIINDTAYNGGRAPNDILASICGGFKNKPKECSQKLEGGNNAPAATGGCGAK